MAFHDVQFPPKISYGSKGGSGFNTTVLTLTSGAEKRNINWQRTRGKYDVSHGIKSRADMQELIEFFHARFGRGHSFRYKDWGDYELWGTETIGTGDGIETDYQIIKTYSSGGFDFVRNITRPVSGTLTGVRVNGVLQVETTNYTVDYNTGIITFLVAPPNTESVTVDACEFDVHCRFETDEMNIIQDFWETSSWDPIPIWEIKDQSG